jgi:pseudomonalisin
MQTDGNLVVYNSAGQARWNTSTGGRNGAVLLVQNDGNAVLYSHLGQPLWWTGTGGR